jgi:hypothetical protein
MPELSWEEAINEVLKNGEAMHYADIGDIIASRQLRDIGANARQTVNVVISTSIRNGCLTYERVGRGLYRLRGAEVQDVTAAEVSQSEVQAETGLINAFGMYWSRSHVRWELSEPRILGKQQAGSTLVDFCKQRGVYLLHDGRTVVYVGRTTDQPLGIRLRQHISDRLGSRWERFSWFGVYPVSNGGELDPPAVGQYDLNMLIVTMEALLIEGLEPPQNRKRGDDFRAVEFLQVEDPDFQREGKVITSETE